MKTELLSKENNEAKLTMEFTAEEFDEACNKAYNKSRNQFMIDGFRKGKAPRGIIERHYGEGVFYEDAINDLFSTNYPEALKEHDLDVIDNPNVDFSEIGKDKPLTMTITVATFPIVEVKDYFGMDIEKMAVDVSEEDIDREIGLLQKRNSRMVVVDREVKDGDTVILDYAGYVGDEAFEGGTAERQELKIGSGQFIPGFEDQLVGAKTGDDVDVNVTFPEDYQAEDLAGKDAVFHCKIHEIKEEELPELDDEFAKDVSEYDTLEELRQHTKEDLEKAREAESEAMARDQVVSKVYEANDVDVPKVMVEDEINNMAQEMDQQLRYQGLGLEQYIQFTGKDMEAFRDELREDATKRVGTRVLLQSIAEKEKVEITEDDIEAELKNMADQYMTEVDKLKEALAGSMDFFKRDVKVRKVIDMLYEKANITEKKPEKEDK